MPSSSDKARFCGDDSSKAVERAIRQMRDRIADKVKTQDEWTAGTLRTYCQREIEVDSQAFVFADNTYDYLIVSLLPPGSNDATKMTSDQWKDMQKEFFNRFRIEYRPLGADLLNTLGRIRQDVTESPRMYVSRFKRELSYFPNHGLTEEIQVSMLLKNARKIMRSSEGVHSGLAINNTIANLELLMMNVHKASQNKSTTDTDDTSDSETSSSSEDESRGRRSSKATHKKSVRFKVPRDATPARVSASAVVPAAQVPTVPPGVIFNPHTQRWEGPPPPGFAPPQYGQYSHRNQHARMQSPETQNTSRQMKQLIKVLAAQVAPTVQPQQMHYAQYPAQPQVHATVQHGYYPQQMHYPAQPQHHPYALAAVPQEYSAPPQQPNAACYKCGRFDHFSKDCTASNQAPRPQLQGPASVSGRGQGRGAGPATAHASAFKANTYNAQPYTYSAHHVGIINMQSAAPPSAPMPPSPSPPPPAVVAACENLFVPTEVEVHGHTALLGVGHPDRVVNPTREQSTDADEITAFMHSLAATQDQHF